MSAGADNYPNKSVMPRLARRRFLTGAVRRDAKRRCTSTTRWMRLSTAEIKNRSTLQLLMANHLVAGQASIITIQKLLLLHHLLENRVIGGPAGNPLAERIVDIALYLSHVDYQIFTSFLRRWFLLDAYLHDITPLELGRSNTLRPVDLERIDLKGVKLKT